MRNSLLWLAAVGCFGACLCGCNGIHGGGDVYDETGGFVGIVANELARLFAYVVDLPSLPAD